MEHHVHGHEKRYYDEIHGLPPEDAPPVLEELRAIAKRRGLWNLFLPPLQPHEPGTPLSILDYAPVSEQLGRVELGSELLSCQAPDTGNMEILHHYYSNAVQDQWLATLLAGEIRSVFSMTEPDVASSDARPGPRPSTPSKRSWSPPRRAP
jgi:acyl-CoA dehydrogenase